MVRFSKKYGSFAAWRKVTSRTSAYALRVIRLHRLNPGASLHQLRQGTHLITSFSKAPFELFTSSQKVEFKQALEVLRLMRKGLSLSKASKKVNLPIRKVLNYLGNTVRRIRGRYYARKSDTLYRNMVFFEDGRRTRITVNNSLDARLIGKYFSAVGRLSYMQDFDALKPFEGIIIFDVDDRKRRFETDPEKVLLILSRIEDFEFFEVYNDD